MLLVTLALSVRIARAQDQPLTQPTMTISRHEITLLAAHTGGACRLPSTARQRQNVRRVVEYLLGNVLLVTLALSVYITRAQGQPLTQPTMTISRHEKILLAARAGGAYRLPTSTARRRQCPACSRKFVR